MFCRDVGWFDGKFYHLEEMAEGARVDGAAFFASLTSEYIDMKRAAIVIDVDVKDLKVGV